MLHTHASTYQCIFRDPVEIMVSNFKGTNNGKMPKGPCLRTKKHPPAAIQAILGKDSERDASGVSNEEYCAAHLAMLCNHALEHIDEVRVCVRVCMRTNADEWTHSCLLAGRPPTNTHTLSFG